MYTVSEQIGRKQVEEMWCLRRVAEYILLDRVQEQGKEQN